MFSLAFFLESDHDYDLIIFDVDSKDTSEGMTTSICRKNIANSGPFPFSLLQVSVSQNLRREYKLKLFRGIFRDSTAISCTP